jgi:hypothetical protein
MARQINWSLVRLGASNVFREVVSVSVDSGAETISGYADTDMFPTSKRIVRQDPSISVVTEDVTNQNTFPVGTAGTLTMIHRDEANANTVGATGVSGDITYTVSNATVQNHSSSGAHASWGQLTTSIFCRSADGVTNPIALAVA